MTKDQLRLEMETALKRALDRTKGRIVSAEAEYSGSKVVARVLIEKTVILDLAKMYPDPAATE